MIKRETKVGIKLGSACFSTRDNDSETQVRIRRVNPKDERSEHIQVEIVVRKFHLKRTTEAFGYVCLTPQQADLMVNSLQRVQPPYDKAARERSCRPREEDAYWAEFYGIENPDRIF